MDEVTTPREHTKSYSGGEYYDELKISEILGFNCADSSAVEKALFTTINEDNRTKLLQIFDLLSSSTILLQILLTTTYPNRDNFYQHDPDDLRDAEELLGSKYYLLISLEHLNAIQIACILGEEDIAMDILEFVTRITEEIEARKVLYEFMGRIWGDGNTTLHLASFMGMCDLVKKMIELGAATSKTNNRKYKPVDCASDDETRLVFETVVEVDRNKRKASVTSPSITDLMSSSQADRARGKEDSSSSLDSSRSSLADSYAVVKHHQKTASADGVRKSRSGSIGRSRNTRSSSQTFAIAELTRSRDNSVGMAKPKKTVRFDPGTMLLHICQHGDSGDASLQQVKDCISRIKSMNNPDIDINNVYSPHQWLTPLHVACSHGKVEIAKLLLSEGAAVNITDKERWTPLHCAAAEGHLEIIKMLGMCQGNSADTDKSHGDWIYVLDGPIDLEPLNDEKELPEDVALEAKETEIIGILKGKLFLSDLKRKYPPPPKLDTTDDEESEEEEQEEEEVELRPIDDFSKNLRRAPSVMKHNRSEHHRRDSDELHPSDVLIYKSPDEIVRPSTPEIPLTCTPLTVSPLQAITPRDTPKINEPDRPLQITTKPSQLAIGHVKEVPLTPKLEEIPKSPLETVKEETKLESNPELLSPHPPAGQSPEKPFTTGLRIQINSPRKPLFTSQSLELLKDDSNQCPDNSHNSTQSLNLLSPTELQEPCTPSGTEPRKVRRANSISRKKPSEFEVERTSHAGEQMRPKELQRRTSKTQRDIPSPQKTDFPDTESIPSVATLKRNLTLLSKEKERTNIKIEAVEPVQGTSIQDKIKMFQGGQDPLKVKANNKGPFAL